MVRAPSLPVRRILAVEHAQQAGPGAVVAGRAAAGGGDDVIGGQGQGHACRLRQDLKLTRLLEIERSDERFAHSLARRNSAVVSQQHDRLVAQVLHQTRAFGWIGGGAAVVVVRGLPLEAERGLGHR